MKQVVIKRGEIAEFLASVEVEGWVRVLTENATRGRYIVTIRCDPPVLEG